MKTDGGPSPGGEEPLDRAEGPAREDQGAVATQGLTLDDGAAGDRGKGLTLTLCSGHLAGSSPELDSVRALRAQLSPPPDTWPRRGGEAGQGGHRPEAAAGVGRKGGQAGSSSGSGQPPPPPRLHPPPGSGCGVVTGGGVSTRGPAHPKVAQASAA
ncbi:translation initiation factor IF-2-like isoform X1 [Elephas maximus indicus]|uniref:translation initiation factor IF-2-like isoform X1 n=1 Tax=Elephas maximus indicus TaxID=99487 RepID=UPI002116BADE|nr:translation initiation factor IF-2-like isoform X1 [Elephas maximus indicus]